MQKLKPIRKLSEWNSSKLSAQEFILRHIEFEKGMIEGWKHVRNLCDVCIKAHRKELTKKRIKEIMEMNK